jgi:putative aldouronate transport system substrate-binding protein
MDVKEDDMRKPVLGFLLLAALLLIAGAGSAAATGKGEPPTGTKPPAAAPAALPYAERFEMSIMRPDLAAFDNAAVIENEIDRRLNMKTTWIKVSSNYLEKLNVTLASGDLPDLVYMQNWDQLYQWVREGAAVDLTGLIATYGANINKRFSADDKKLMKNPLDGKVYGVPGIVELKELNTLAIRKDWLDNLGLQIPETLAEWENVLRQLKAKDPAGNQSTIPWGGNTTDLAGLAALRPFTEAYGIMTEGAHLRWTLTKDNKYISTYEHPRYRELLTTLRKYYAEGLIDKEFMVRKTPLEVQQLFHSGRAAAGIHASWTAQQLTNTLVATNPKAVILPVKPIKGPYGDQMLRGRPKYFNPAAISIKAQRAGKAEKVMQRLDWVYSDGGIELYNFGIEGIHHKNVDGKPVLIGEYTKGWAALRKDGLNPFLIGFYWSLDAYKQSMLSGKKLEELTPLERIPYDGLFLNTPYIYNPVLTLVTKADQELGADIFPFLEENEVKAIVGEITIDQFFQALDRAKKDGLDKISAETAEQWRRIQ